MIVDPDFLGHWRTRMLADMLEDECAPIYIIRLWGHCQSRRGWVFDGMPVQATKAICHYQGDAKHFEKALIECGFLSRQGDRITVVGWDEHNATLIANWTNGKRGGRPKGSTKETREKPTGKPRNNPSDNPTETDKIGLDEIGLDDTDIKPGASSEASEPALVLLPTNKHNTEGEEYPVTQSQIDEWQEVYPAVNCLAEVKQARLWLKANPKKRKTYGGMAKFLNGWMSRQQDKGGSSYHQPSESPRPSHRAEMPKPDRPPRREQ